MAKQHNICIGGKSAASGPADMRFHLLRMAVHQKHTKRTHSHLSFFGDLIAVVIETRIEASVTISPNRRQWERAAQRVLKTAQTIAQEKYGVGRSAAGVQTHQHLKRTVFPSVSVRKDGHHTPGSCSSQHKAASGANDTRSASFSANADPFGTRIRSFCGKISRCRVVCSEISPSMQTLCGFSN